MRIITGKVPKTQKLIVYGPEGIGKSTFASQFPDTLFIDTEDSTTSLDVARFERPQSWEMLKAQVRHVISNPDICKTLAIDTLDWAEKLCMEHLISVNKWDSIETPGYGKGFTILAEEWGHFLNMLSDVIERGINVVCTAHAQMRKFEQPDELGAYDRWELKLQRKTAPLTKEWADMLLFANYKTIVITDPKTKSKKGQGGQRVMYTTHHPAWDAKNRVEGMPEELPFEFAQIAHLFDQAPAPVQAAKNTSEPQTKSEASSPVEDKFVDLSGLPSDLVQLMQKDNVYPHQLEVVCGPQSTGGKGYFPGDMKLQEYPKDFFPHLVTNWAGFLEAVKKTDFLAAATEFEVPFDI